MNSIIKILSVLALPIGLLNMLGGVVSGIWLAILGKWGLIGYGILAMIFAGFGLGLAFMLGMIFAGPAAYFMSTGNRIGALLFGFLSSAYTSLVLVIWCVAVLIYATKQSDAASYIPSILWSYGVATGPIAWLAEKDLQSGNEFATILSFFVQLAFIISASSIILTPTPLYNVLMIFGSVMGVGLLIQFYAAYVEQ